LFVPFPHIPAPLLAFAYLFNWLNAPANTFQHLITASTMPYRLHIHQPF
jgi:hypothetical protein